MSSPRGLEEVGIVAMTVLVDWRRVPSLDVVVFVGAGTGAEGAGGEGLYHGIWDKREKRGKRMFRYMLSGLRALLEWVI
jgi:hypothetical protein